MVLTAMVAGDAAAVRPGVLGDACGSVAGAKGRAIRKGQGIAGLGREFAVQRQGGILRGDMKAARIMGQPRWLR